MSIALFQQYIPKIILPYARWIYCLYQKYRTIFFSYKEREKYQAIKKDNKKNILIYHKSLLSFWGTEKNLQIIAKYLDKSKYNIHIMYGIKEMEFGNYTHEVIEKRKRYVNEWWHITWIPFDYSKMHSKHPYVLDNMTPSIQDTISYYNIDCVISAWAGNAEFPLTNIACPIIFLNIFGIPNTLPNIKKQICISNLVKNMIADIVQNKKLEVQYIPSEWPPSSSVEDGKIWRNILWIPENHIIFWRIWRADQTIYDPIGIKAFNITVKKYPFIHYVIISPAPQLIEFVQKNNIPNIHLIEPISNEQDIRAFHNMIDVFAHYRLDGETCGLAIAESMLCWNPIISHKSHIRNAHLEYLDNNISFISEKDDYEKYASYMEIFALDKEKKLIKKMWNNAKEKAYELFHIKTYITKFHKILDSVIL